MTVAKKNAAFYHAFPAVDSTTPETFKTGLTVADSAYSKDGAGVWTSLAITDAYAEIGTTGVYEITLTAAEMNHDQILIKQTGAGMADDFIMLDTRTKLTDDLNDFDSTTDPVSSLTSAVANQIADHVLRRTWANAEASGDGDTIAFRSLLGAVAKLVNRVGITGTDLLTYRDDDTTVLGTQALTTDASADPITGIDTT